MHNCNRCGNKLVKRINSKTKQSFMGCSNYPSCKGPIKLYDNYYVDVGPANNYTSDHLYGISPHRANKLGLWHREDKDFNAPYLYKGE